MRLFKRKKEVALTSEEKVQEVRKSIESSLSMFSKVHEDISKANETLEEIIQEDTQRKAEIENNIKNAESELESNKARQEKLEAFIN